MQENLIKGHRSKPTEKSFLYFIFIRFRVGRAFTPFSLMWGSNFVRGYSNTKAFTDPIVDNMQYYLWCHLVWKTVQFSNKTLLISWMPGIQNWQLVWYGLTTVCPQTHSTPCLPVLFDRIIVCVFIYFLLLFLSFLSPPFDCFAV